jgi:hypothetical protein
MSKNDKPLVRIKKYKSYLSPGEWVSDRGWRIERFSPESPGPGEDWKLIAYRGSIESARDVADQACLVLGTSYKVDE